MVLVDSSEEACGYFVPREDRAGIRDSQSAIPALSKQDWY